MFKTVFLASISALAYSTAALADPLDDAAAVCVTHQASTLSADFGTPRNPKTPPAFQTGWEHCARILSAKKSRDDAAALLDESKDPTLKATRDLAKQLGN